MFLLIHIQILFRVLPHPLGDFVLERNYRGLPSGRTFCQIPSQRFDPLTNLTEPWFFSWIVDFH